ncbi:MAG: signal peptidase I [Candidatus Hodarchaeota archaeon]
MQRKYRITLKKKSADKKKPISKKKIIISLFLILFAFLGSFLIYFILQLALNTETPMVVVISDSMAPKINKGDLLFIQGRDPEDIEIGDVIVFDADGLWSGAPEEPIVHRVVDRRKVDDDWEFRTKGDANSDKDEEWIPEKRVKGVVIGRIPYIGWIKIVLADYGLFIPVLIILSVPLVISILWDVIKGEEKEKEKTEKIEDLKEDIKVNDEIKSIKKVE